MPSAPGYKRDYNRETETAKARGEDEGNRLRKRARRKLQAKGMVKPNDGKEIDHVKPLSKGGSNGDKNLRVTTVSKNRAFPRNTDGSMK
jgi:5-methylcytosine-specific restriction endonuclease McrA